MVEKIKQVLLKKVYAGYIVGAVCTLIAYELTEPWRVLIMLLLMFGGFALAEKHCH